MFTAKGILGDITGGKRIANSLSPTVRGARCRGESGCAAKQEVNLGTKGNVWRGTRPKKGERLRLKFDDNTVPLKPGKN